jgi:branched-chain amino acid transport system substrate-binding protein
MKNMKGKEMLTRTAMFLVATLALTVIDQTHATEKKYSPGVTDTEIKLGQFAAYSGPLSSFSIQNKAGIAFFDMINAQGGIHAYGHSDQLRGPSVP